jgi:hypothetical protein
VIVSIDESGGTNPTDSNATGIVSGSLASSFSLKSVSFCYFVPLETSKSQKLNVIVGYSIVNPIHCR